MELQDFGTQYVISHTPFVARTDMTQNWYDQSILIPQLCSISCLILKDAPLSDTQRAGCERIPKRAYDLRDGVYGSGGRMTGANVRHPTRVFSHEPLLIEADRIGDAKLSQLGFIPE